VFHAATFLSQKHVTQRQRRMISIERRSSSTFFRMAYEILAQNLLGASFFPLAFSSKMRSVLSQVDW